MAQWQHNPITERAGTPPAEGKPVAFAWEHDHTQHIVYRGNDSQLHELWYRKDFGANWKDGGVLTQIAGAPQAAGSPSAYAWESEKTQHIVYRGADSQIHELWFKKDLLGGHWNYGGAISANVGAPAAAGDPYGYVWEGDQTQHIVYRGTDNNIHELWFKRDLTGGHWNYNGQINVKAGSPAAAGDPAGFAWESDKTQHIVYRGSDNQIHELWFKHDGLANQWAYGGALSSNTHAPAAAGNPMGYSWEDDHTQHVVYRGTDDQIHELWFKKDLLGAHWNYGGALSANTGAPHAAGDPCGYVWDGDKTQHIAYRAADNQVHELYFKKGMTGGGSWQHGTSLSQSANAPAAASDPEGYAWEGDGTQHVVYTGADSQVHELWFKH